MEEIPHMGDLYPVNIPIQMMCVVDTTGRINPVRFRFRTEDHELITVNVEQTVGRDRCNYVGIREKQFICTAVIDGRRRTLEIRYNIETQKWRIFRFLS